MNQKIIIEMTAEEFKRLQAEAIREALRDFQPAPAPPPPKKEESVMSIVETANLLKYHKATVSRNYDQWGLTPIRRGRQLFFPTQQVHRLRDTLFQLHGAPLPKEKP